MSKLEDDLALQIKAAGLPEPKREYRFHPKRRWRLDFAWPGRAFAALEVDGGEWVQGRHGRPKGMRADCEKYNAAVQMGWRVYRVTGSMVRDGSALKLLEAVL